MDELLTPKETAARLKVAVNTLRDWRRLGKGPKYIKNGHLVRYRVSAVESWLNTAQGPKEVDCSMDIRTEFIPEGHPNRPGTKLEALKALVFHWTANDAPSATDTMNARYFGRVWLGTPDKPFEADGKTPFRYGSTQVIVDEDSVTIAIPTDEAAWACGDRNAGAWTQEWKGQRPLARNLFGWRQNYQTVNIEICNNRSWEKAVDMAARYAISFLRNRGLYVLAEQSMAPPDKPILAANGILLLRHGDITGKGCPRPMMQEQNAWKAFVTRIAESVR